MLLNSLLIHEIQNLLKSRRIYTTLLMFLLIFVSIFAVRVISFQQQLNQYIADVQQADDIMANPVNYSHINPRAVKQPLLFSVYNQGFSFARVIDIQTYHPITTPRAINETRNRLHFTSNSLDITFLITCFFSLFILLITYDSVNGEKQTGTLRLLLTYPIKRQSVILKKLLGAFMFVGIAFSIPYILSVFYLVAIYASILNSSFFLSVFFYWFLFMLFILFFCILGVLLSVCSMKPSRSLVYSLTTWVTLCIILPTTWDYFISRKLHSNELLLMEHAISERNIFLNQILEDLPDEVNIMRAGTLHTNFGYTRNFELLAFGKSSHELYIRFLHYLYDTFYPAARELEAAVDTINRKWVSIENTRNAVFFFNPIVLMSSVSNHIAGNGRGDYLNFLLETRAIRDQVVSIGVSDGWLLDFRFWAVYADENLANLSEEEMDYLNMLFNSDPDRALATLREIVINAEPFTFEMPFIPRYTQSNPTFWEMFYRIAGVLGLLVLNILAMWMLTWVRFMKYDVR